MSIMNVNTKKKLADVVDHIIASGTAADIDNDIIVNINGFDVNISAYNGEQLVEVCEIIAEYHALGDYINPKYSASDMRELYYGLNSNLEVTSISSIPGDIHKLDDKYAIKTLILKVGSDEIDIINFTSFQLLLVFIGLKCGDELSRICTDPMYFMEDIKHVSSEIYYEALMDC